MACENFCSQVHFQGCLCNQKPWRTEMVFPFGQRADDESQEDDVYT